MSRTSKPKVWMAGCLALAVSVAAPGAVRAISTIVPGGLIVERPGGGPLAQTTVDIVFGGEPAQTKTDDKGFVALLLVDGPTAKIEQRNDIITLIGDGKGLVTWDGGRVPFEVRDGALRIPNDKGGPLGLGTAGYVGGAAGGAAVLFTIGNIASGGDNDTINPNTSGSNTNTNTGNTIPATTPNGIYVLDWETIEDLRNSAQFVRLSDSRQTTITVNGSTIAFNSQPPMPMAQGSYADVAFASGAAATITARGAGPLAGRPNVLVTLEGTLTAGTLNATVTVGADGSLGAPLPHEIKYRLRGTKQP
jgi:hypothetical protein